MISINTRETVGKSCDMHLETHRITQTKYEALLSGSYKGNFLIIGKQQRLLIPGLIVCKG